MTWGKKALLLIGWVFLVAVVQALLMSSAGGRDAAQFLSVVGFAGIFVILLAVRTDRSRGDRDVLDQTKEGSRRKK